MSLTQNIEYLLSTVNWKEENPIALARDVGDSVDSIKTAYNGTVGNIFTAMENSSRREREHNVTGSTFAGIGTNYSANLGGFAWVNAQNHVYNKFANKAAQELGNLIPNVSLNLPKLNVGNVLHRIF